MLVTLSDVNEMARICRAYQQDPDSALALVTLVENQGKSYRRPGARMLVKRDGSTVGSISGGCLEGDLAELARHMDAEGVHEKLEMIDTRPIFGCHGTITLFVELIQPRRSGFDEWMAGLADALRQRRRFSLQTRYRNHSSPGTGIHTEALKDLEETGTFVQTLGLQKRIVVVGAHGDVRPLLKWVLDLGWQAIQIIPGSQRQGWIGQDLEGVKVEYFSPAEIVSRVEPDESTAVVVMTHNIGRDIEFASRLLLEPYAYVGMLGSQKRRDEVYEHLASTGEHGLIEKMEWLHCPAGTDIGSETQEEIALSILSEIQAVFSGRSGTFLKDGNSAIHAALEND